MNISYTTHGYDTDQRDLSEVVGYKVYVALGNRLRDITEFGAGDDLFKDEDDARLFADSYPRSGDELVASNPLEVWACVRDGDGEVMRSERVAVFYPLPGINSMLREAIQRLVHGGAHE